MTHARPARVALVTGASGSIGRAAAVALGAAGMRVGVGYGANRDAAGQCVKEIEASGGHAAAVQVDVSDSAAVDAAFSEIEQRWAPVEVLVNAAGITRDGLLARMGDEQWAAVLRTNLDGAFHTMRRAAPKMMRGRFGRIVNVGSVVGLTGSPGQANYAAAKAGLVGLSRAVARELASRGVTCNVVAPGPIATPMTEVLSEERRKEFIGAVPLARFGSAEEVAAVVAFLCSDAAGYVTGAVVPVDGGLGMGH